MEVQRTFSGREIKPFNSHLL